MKRKVSWITISQLSSVRSDTTMARTKKQHVSGDAVFVRREERRTARGAVTYVPKEAPLPRAHVPTSASRSPSKSPSKAASHDAYSEPVQEHVVFDDVMPMKSLHKVSTVALFGSLNVNAEGGAVAERLYARMASTSRCVSKPHHRARSSTR